MFFSFRIAYSTQRTHGSLFMGRQTVYARLLPCNRRARMYINVINVCNLLFHTKKQQ